MNELIAKIEQWAEDRNIIKGSKPIDQAMKLFSEFGELADNVGKGCDCRDDIGDVFVVLTIINKQYGKSLHLEDRLVCTHDGLKECVMWLGYSLADEITDTCHGDKYDCYDSLSILNKIAELTGTTLKECVKIAYNDIKDRKGLMHNGVFIKESDLAYQDALDNIEADKRMTTQKRISVNIEDL